MIFKMDADESKAANILIGVGCYIAFVSGILRDAEALMVVAFFLTFAGFLAYVHSPAGSFILAAVVPFSVFSFAGQDEGLILLLAGLYIWLWWRWRTPIAINLALAALIAVFLLKGYPVFDDAPDYGRIKTEPSEAYMHGRAAIALVVFGSMLAAFFERWWRTRDELD